MAYVAKWMVRAHSTHGRQTPKSVRPTHRFNVDIEDSQTLEILQQATRLKLPQHHLNSPLLLAPLGSAPLEFLSIVFGVAELSSHVPFKIITPAKLSLITASILASVVAGTRHIVWISCRVTVGKRLLQIVTTANRPASRW